jgi:hypothetical protein
VTGEGLRGYNGFQGELGEIYGMGIDQNTEVPDGYPPTISRPASPPSAGPYSGSTPNSGNAPCARKLTLG